ncbi:MAG: hypothetical protein HQM09_21935, partial [Candidatus Riflebacteria bacterium]|nr:hypothetical protein [Candidatus Riflebacteria bacterium]
RSCLYYHLYAAQDSERIGESAEEIPRPYSIRWSSFAEEFRPGEILDVELTLVGRSIGLTPLVAAAFGIAGSKGFGLERYAFRLTRVRLRGAEDRQSSLLNGKMLVSDVPRGFSPYLLEPLPSNAVDVEETVALKFITPVQLQKRMGVDYLLRGSDLLRKTILRISALDSAWSDGKWANSIRGKLSDAIERCQITENKTAWKHVDRYSMTQGRRLPLFGREGHITLAGVPASLLPLMHSLEHLHLGRHAVNGLGAIRVSQSGLK